MFNTVAVTLPPALKTGNLEVRTDCVAAQVRMNSENRAQGVTYIERFTMKPMDVDAKYVILAASTLENTRLLLLSAKGGLANSSGVLGQYLMDQIGGNGVDGFLPKLRGGPSRLDDGKYSNTLWRANVPYCYLNSKTTGHKRHSCASSCGSG